MNPTKALKFVVIGYVLALMSVIVVHEVAPNGTALTAQAHPHPPATHGPDADPPHSQEFDDLAEQYMIESIDETTAKEAVVELFIYHDHQIINCSERLVLIEERIGDGIVTSEQLDAAVAALQDQLDVLNAMHTPTGHP